MKLKFMFDYITRTPTSTKEFLLPKVNYKINQVLREQFNVDPYSLTNDPRSLQRYFKSISMHVYSNQLFEDLNVNDDKTQLYNDVFKDDMLSRLTIQRSLQNHAEYIILGDNKAPVFNHYRGKKVELNVPERLFKRTVNKTMTVDTPPMSGPYGIKPKENSKLYILDIDLPKGLKNLPEDDVNKEGFIKEYLHKVLKTLSSKLKTNLYNTIAQESASGGLHIFLLIPDGIKPHQLPSANLRPYKALHEDLGFTLDGDVRSGASHGYIVGPGSSILNEDDVLEKYSFASINNPKFKSFLLGRKQRLLTIHEDGITWLRNMRILHEQEKLNKSLKVTLSTENALILRYNRGAWREEDSREDQLEDELIFQRAIISAGKGIRLKNDYKTVKSSDLVKDIDDLINTEIIEASNSLVISESHKMILSHKMANRENIPFHMRRAYLYRALSCCYSFKEIAEVSKELKVNRDSYTDSELSAKALLDDYERFISLYGKSVLHGGFCNVSSQKSSDKSMTEEERNWFKNIIDTQPSMSVGSLKALKRSYDKLLKLRSYDYSFKPRDAFVIDLVMVAYRIFKNNERISQVKKDAFNLIVYYFNPLSNVGAKRVIVSRRFIEDNFKLSESRVAAALRFLRNNNFIKLKVKQKTGMAPLYEVNKRYSSTSLTKILRKTWGASKIINKSTDEAFYLSSVFNPFSGELMRPDGSSYSNSVLKEHAFSVSSFLDYGIFKDFDFVSNAFTYSAKPIASYLEVKEKSGFDYEKALELIRLKVSELEEFFKNTGHMSFVSPTIKSLHSLSNFWFIKTLSESKVIKSELGIITVLRSGNSPPLDSVK